MEFWRYYRIIRKRRWLIILGMLVCVGAVLMSGFNAQEQWIAKTTLMESKGMSDQGTPLFPEQYAQLDLQLRLSNLSNIATSRKVLENAASALEDYALDYTPEYILSHTSVAPEKDTNILAISVTLPSKQNAEDAAEVIAMEFMRVYGELNNEAITKSRIFIEAQLDTTRKAMTKAQNELRRFKEENGIVMVEAQDQAIVQRYHQTKLDNNAATVAYHSASARASAAERELATQPQWRKESYSTSRDPLWQSLSQELMSLETQRAGMLNGAPGQQRRLDNHPEVRELKSKIADVKAKMANCKEQYVSTQVEARNGNYSNALDRLMTAKIEQVASQAQANATQAVMDGMAAEMAEVPAKDARMAELQLDVNAASQTYNLMRTKLDEARLREEQAKNEIALQIIDRPLASRADNKFLLKLILSVILSPLLGIGAAFLLYYTDNSIKTSSEAEKMLGLPILSEIPASSAHSLARQKCSDIVNVSYQMLTSNLWIASQNLGINDVVVVSAEPNSGRSVIASNLATALAQEGARVVIVDADFRQPTQHMMFGTDNKVGLTNILSGAATLEDALVPTKVQGLLLIPTGPIPENPVKLLRSAEMREFVEQIKDVADFVVYDTPSGITFPDPVLVATSVGSAIVVHSAGRVSRGSEADFKARMESVGVKMIGAVLNKVKREDSSGYFHYRRSYEGFRVAQAPVKRTVKGRSGDGV